MTGYTFSQILTLALILSLGSRVTAADEKSPIWRSVDMAKTICEQEAKFNETGQIPEPVKDKETKEYCGWFQKAYDGDACSGTDYVRYWACKSQSGISGVSGRIVGGHETRPHKYPSMLGLVIANQGRCGAAILSAEWVVTAAHCILSKTPGDYRIVAGDHNINKDEGSEQIVTGSKVVVHEKYNGKLFHNDIALIKVSPQFQFNDKVSGINLPPADFQPNGTGIATGWGNQKETGVGTSSLVLLEVEVPMISTEKCQASYPTNNVTDDMLCAGYDEGGKDACQGDSGGPLFTCIDKRLVHVGITSWGEGCARPGKPGVYTKTAHYLDWIKQNAQG